MELTFEIPAAEGSEPPLLRRESSSSPASGESVVFSPEKKKVPKQRRNPSAAGESQVLWLCDFVTMRFLFSAFESWGLSFFGWKGSASLFWGVCFCFLNIEIQQEVCQQVCVWVAKKPPGVGVWGSNQKQVIWDSRLGSFWFYSHYGSMVRNWDEFTYSTWIRGWFWMGFSWLGKYTGPGNVPTDLILWDSFGSDLMKHFLQFPAPTRPKWYFEIFSFIPLEVGFFRIFRIFLVPKIGSW